MNRFTKRKVHLAIIALVFLGQSLFAGEGSRSGLGQRRVNRTGFIAPVLQVAARAMDAVVARQEQDATTEGVHPGETKMEKPEGDEGVSPLENLPPEVIIYYLIPHLGDRELGRLALTSSWGAELVREELEKRYTDHRIRELAGRASSPYYLVRKQAAQEMGELLTSSDIELTYEQVVALLFQLIGDNGHVGLVGDGNHWVRCRTAETIGLVLASGKCNEEGHSRLLHALIGDDTHRGLAGDDNNWVRRDAAEAIGPALASGECNEEGCSRLLHALIGDATHRGLAGDGYYWVRVGMIQSTSVILASEKCGENVRTRLLNVLIGDDGQGGLAGDEDSSVRWHVAKAIGVILASGKCVNDKCPRLLTVLDRLAKDPDCDVHIKAREAIRLAREAPAPSESLE